VVLEPSLAVVTVATDPFRERGAGDVELGCDVGDRAAQVDDLGDSTLPSNDSQGALRWCMERASSCETVA